MKFLLIFFCIFFLTSSFASDKYLSFQKNNKIKLDRALISTLKDILSLIEEKDFQTLNKSYINKDFGFYEIGLDLEGDILIESKKYLKISNFSIDSLEIKFEEVFFDCSPYDDAFYAWNKEGVFISRRTQNYLKNHTRYVNYRKKNFLKAILKNSFEVVITPDIVFYLSKYNKRFYISLVDKLKTNCSFE